MSFSTWLFDTYLTFDEAVGAKLALGTFTLKTKKDADPSRGEFRTSVRKKDAEYLHRNLGHPCGEQREGGMDSGFDLRGSTNPCKRSRPFYHILSPASMLNSLMKAHGAPCEHAHPYDVL